jgi:hypothetical protein
MQQQALTIHMQLCNKVLFRVLPDADEDDRRARARDESHESRVSRLTSHESRVTSHDESHHDSSSVTTTTTSSSGVKSVVFFVVSEIRIGTHQQQHSSDGDSTDMCKA